MPSGCVRRRARRADTALAPDARMETVNRAPGEIGIAARAPVDAPQHQGRVQRHRSGAVGNPNMGRFGGGRRPAIPVENSPARRETLVSKSIASKVPLHTRIRMFMIAQRVGHGEKTASPTGVISQGGRAWPATTRSLSSDKEGRTWRPSRRRLESRLCRLRDRDDGLLPADVADQHHHARTETRHRRLFRAPVHRPDRVGQSAACWAAR